MTNINGVHSVASIQQAAAVSPAAPAQAAAPAAQAADVVEISTIAQLAAQIQELPPVRTELIERVKAELAAGTYETPEKIEIALNRLMDELVD